MPTSSRIFAAKRKHKDVHEHRSSPASRSPKQHARETEASRSSSTQAQLAVTPAAARQPSPAAASSVLDVASILAPCSDAEAQPAPRAQEEEEFYVPATAPEANEPKPPASDEAPSQ